VLDTILGSIGGAFMRLNSRLAACAPWLLNSFFAGTVGIVALEFLAGLAGAPVLPAVALSMVAIVALAVAVVGVDEILKDKSRLALIGSAVLAAAVAAARLSGVLAPPLAVPSAVLLGTELTAPRATPSKPPAEDALAPVPTTSHGDAATSGTTEAPKTIATTRGLVGSLDH